MAYPYLSYKIVSQSKNKKERYPQLKYEGRNFCETGSDIEKCFTK